MNAVAERTQVLELVKTLPDEQLDYVLHIIKSLPNHNPISEIKQKARDERDKRDMEIINANAGRFNEDAEENLEFQADLWGDE